MSITRRDLLRIGFTCMPIGLTIGLPGCVGDGTPPETSSTTSSSTCAQATYGTGLQFATQAALSKISFALKSAAVAPVLPTTFDLSNSALLATFGLQPLLPPIGNQGQQNSCVAWSVGYAQVTADSALDAQLSIPSGSTASPADLYAKILAVAKVTCDTAVAVQDALDVMVVQGIASETQVPYNSQSCASPSTESTFILNSYSQLAPDDLVGIKLALFDLQVLPIALNLYSDFEDATGSSVYTHSADDTSCSLGGHCVAVVGYDDTRNAFRIMNSWGTSWGDNGYLWMDYGTFQNIVQEVYVSPNKNPLTGANTLLPGSTLASGPITLTNGAASIWVGLPNSTAPYSVAVIVVFDGPVQIQSVVLSYVAPNSADSLALASYSLQQFTRATTFEAPISSDTSNTIQATGGYISTQIQGLSAAGDSLNFVANTSLLFKS